MKVNMTPNPLDVVTIHASQGDSEARQWEFELHNNGELIDTSDVKEQMVFKSYKGGTEQILPENGAVPVTAPFVGDIKYPDATRTDQEFLYRESPTEEDGLAKITDIKGNTIVWNQLVQNGNFADTSLWRTYASTGFSVSNNVGSFTVTGATGAIYQTNTPTYVNGHKYLVIADFYVSQQTNISVEVSGTRGQAVSVNANTWYRYSDIVTPSAQGNFSLTCGQASVQVKNVMCFDITKMGLDITDPSDFTSLFPLSYYSYNQGTLLSFNGNGIKTVGKNLFDFSQFANGTITFENGVLTGTASQFNISYGDVVNAGIELKYPKNTQITISFDARTEQNYSPEGLGIYLYASENGTAIQLATTLNNTTAIQHKTVTIPSNRHIDKLGWTFGSNGANIWHITNFQVEFGTETEYNPYTSTTTDLPISTYFPTGMKSAGNVYDELTESKAITRIGSVDLGSLTWSYRTSGSALAPYFMTSFSGIKSQGAPSTNKANILCSKYQTVKRDETYFIDKTICADGDTTTLTQIQIKDSSFTDATAFKESLQGVYLYYEMVAETETSFTTASLVTENAEIPLSNEDGVLIGKCTEELSENPGFIDAKIKLADADGTCYSNKIQLHVERSPQ